MKKISLLISLSITCFISAKAQDDKASGIGLHFAAGINLALPVGHFSNVSSFGVGAEVLAEYNFLEEISAVGTTGYTYFFGKAKANGIGFIPVLVGARYYPVQQFFVGTKVGLGVLTGSGSNTRAFDYQPQVGYNSTKVQVALGYNDLLKKGETLSNVSLTLMYKFK